MEIIGLVIIFPFSSFLIMVLGGGDGSKPSVSFLKFEPRSQIFPRVWDKSPSLSIVFVLSSKTQWLSGLYYADFISFYSSTQLCGGGTTKSNSNELPISVSLSFTTATIIVLGDFVAFLISLSNSLASDICSVKEPFCVLFVEFTVNNGLPVFDGFCCGDQHVNTSSV